ncbi:Alpha/beta hydrolase fold-3 [Penicillium tannophilum]|nr:Alpha/beta hydrolase fold-3 [Penicillium tannophilum]
MSTPDYFSSDPDWEAFATKNDIPLPSTTPGPLSAPIDFTQSDFASMRAEEATYNAEWAKKHPIEEVGYTAKSIAVRARDGTDIDVKVSFPLLDRPQPMRQDGNSLPVLFVTHGGGWIQGNHTVEELWFLYPLYTRFDLVIASVEYRLAPENRFPTWIEDCEDVLDALLDSPEEFLGLNENIKVPPREQESVPFSQICRDKGIPINGIILNVPMLCDPRNFPLTKNGPFEESLRSYTQCMDIFMGSSGLLGVWNLIHPDPASSLNIQASPLLGDLKGLPRHLIFVAGQDPLRDEGIAYARKLEEGNVPVTLHVYKGVPHNFGHYWELKATKMFWEDMKATLQKWVVQ